VVRGSLSPRSCTGVSGVAPGAWGSVSATASSARARDSLRECRIAP
jgi:hypothetical protein